jgi:uncharacterized protein YecE (DUF72 family)
MGRYHVGPAGWSYEDWQGIVYPAGKPRGFHPLAFLALYFNTVEINSTFYRPASAGIAFSWVRRVSGVPDFLFSVKVHRSFTHERTGFTAADVRVFTQGMEPLKSAGRLAALLLQFPWSFGWSPENRDYLLRLFDAFAGWPLALEVRHDSWDTAETHRLLTERSVAWCNIDQPLFGHSIKPEAVVTNPDLSYVRLHGRNKKDWFRAGAGRDDRYNYLYAQDELADWVDRIKSLGRGSSRVFVITNNHYQGQAVANALQIRNLLTGEKLEIPETLLKKFPALKDIVKRIQSGQLDLFAEDGGKKGRPA